MNIDTSNKAAPGLFPDLDFAGHGSQLGDPRNSTTGKSGVELEAFSQMVSELPRGYKSAMKQDNFYLLKQYNKRAQFQDSDNEISYRDFKEYDATLQRENEMRQKLQDLEKALSNNGMKIQKLDNLHALYTRDTSSTTVRRTRYRTRVSSFMRKLKPSPMKNLVNSRLRNQNSSLRPQGSNVTVIIDNGKPECDFIDDPEVAPKKLTIIQEELAPISTISFDESSSIHMRELPHQVTIQRKLQVRHLQMISLGATIGVGLFLSSGKAFSIAGPMGAFIGFAIGGSLILATLFSFAEMVALIPLITGISGLCSRFVGDAFGFSVGWCHWLSYAIGFASEVIASTIMLSYYKNLEQIATNKSMMALTITMIVAGLTLVNLMDVRVYGEFEYFSSAFKLLIVVLLIILMIVLNVGGLKNDYIGFRYWNSNKSPLKEMSFGPFRPTFDLRDRGYGATEGIPGLGGIILSCIASTLTSVFAYVGSEIGFIAAGEARNPRKAVPSVTKRIFTRVIIFYLLSIFVVGLNVYSGDPRLLRYNTSNDISALIKGVSNYQEIINALGGSNCQQENSDKILPVDNPNQSPWVIAMQSFNQCTLSAFINGVFVAIGISAASSQLYASSRTLYSMATQQKAPSFFAKCSRNGVPYIAVLFCGALGFLSLLCLNMNSSEVFFTFVSIGALGSVIMWLGMNISYLRFYYALKQRPDIISRDAREYPYKSPFQPFLSIYGAVLAILLIILNGFQNFFLWNTKNFITSYITLVLFVLLYLAYGWMKGSKIDKIEQLDLDSGRREMDRVIWKEDLDYSLNLKEAFNKLLTYL
ncbi:LANO_0E09648g1_1 [Lachancea nothofagi CBS 11611]|uniref:LANO_0E09648g1_1 n=1 Tax=Lachancea nothofagi CBS 11611 TaxID=1266666 RepID=A0A1G4JVZ5_9SACH|nr:LANO_0E09648g1_1 [Lachancea nothofagi CBS 11611]